MSVDERHQQILALVKGSGYLAIDGLAKHFQVTPQTIRRDLNRLAEDGRLVRHHGGASIQSSVRNTRYEQRRTDRAREKAAIAQRLAQWLPDGCSLFLSLGTTTLALAHALRIRKGLKVITNSLEAAQALLVHPDTEVILLGGRLEGRNLGVSGTTTVAALDQYRVDACLFSVGGIDQDGSLLEYHEGEVAVVRAMMRRARQSVLAIDHSKFGRTAAVRLGAITEVSAIVTDQALPANLARLLRRSAVELLIANDTAPRSKLAR